MMQATCRDLSDLQLCATTILALLMGERGGSFSTRRLCVSNRQVQIQSKSCHRLQRPSASGWWRLPNRRHRIVLNSIATRIQLQPAPLQQGENSAAAQLGEAAPPAVRPAVAEGEMPPVNEQLRLGIDNLEPNQQVC